MIRSRLYRSIYTVGFPLFFLSFFGSNRVVYSQRPGIPAVFDSGQWYEIDENDGRGEFVPYPPITDSYKSNDTTIMVSISSFRDFRCPITLYNLLS